MTPANIYHGPLSALTIGGSDMGALGEANVSITWEPAAYTLHDGQQLQVYGLGKVEIELSETDSTHMATILSAATTPAIVIATGLDGSVYTLPSILLTHKVSRTFGDDVHKVTVTGQKKTVSEASWCTIS